MPSRALLRKLSRGALVVIAAAWPCGAAVSIQEAVLRAKPAVVRVVAEVAAEVHLDCGDGTRRVVPTPLRETASGWIIDANGWVVTNGHVVQSAHAPSDLIRTTLTRRAAEKTCLGTARGAEGPRRPAFETVLAKAQTRLTPSVSVILSNGARLPAQIEKYSPPVAAMQMSSRDLALLKVAATDLPVLPVASSAKVLIGNPTYVLGYPDVVLTHELLQQGLAAEATVTTGAVSGFKSDIAGHAVLQTDAPAAFGHSGGPAVNAEGEVIGVMTFVSTGSGSEGTVVQGFNFIIPVADILDFSRGTPVRPTGASKFNELWWAGLADFFQMNYRAAAKKFAAADAVIPDLPDVKRVLAEARARPTPLPWAAIAAVVTSSTTLLYTVMWIRRWQRNRFRISPADTARLLEDVDHPPLLLDVRAPAAYAQSPLRIPRSIRVNPDDPVGAGVQVEPGRLVVAYCT